MEFKLRFTEKEITAWGGMGLMKQMLDRIDFARAVESCGLPQPGSNRGYAPTQLILNSCYQYGAVQIGLNMRKSHGMTQYLRSCLVSNAWLISRRSRDCSDGLIKRL